MLLLIFIYILSSCDLGASFDLNPSNIPRNYTIPFSPEIVGEYYGPTHYYIKDSVLGNLSYTGYSIINRKSADLFTLSFDTTFRYYTIPDIDFELVAFGAGSAKIVLTPGQEYTLHLTYGSRFFTQPGGVVDYYLGLQSIDPDSIYNLRIHGIKQNN